MKIERHPIRLVEVLAKMTIGDHIHLYRKGAHSFGMIEKIMKTGELDFSREVIQEDGILLNA